VAPVLGAINSPNGGYVKGGVDWALKWAGPVGLGRLASAHFSPVGLCNVVQGGKGRCGRPDSGKAGGVGAREGGGKGSRSCREPV
jgi:hypothetical protein